MNTNSYNKFLKALAKGKGEFCIVDKALIRNEDGYCPLTYVCFQETGKNFLSYRYAEAASLIGIDEDDANRIAAAADGEKTLACIKIRKHMLRVLKLKDPE